LLTGQWATDVPRSAKIAMSSSVSQTAWKSRTSGTRPSIESRYEMIVDPVSRLIWLASSAASPAWRWKPVR
jgi:hypothetical protein